MRDEIISDVLKQRRHRYQHTGRCMPLSNRGTDHGDVLVCGAAMLGPENSVPANVSEAALATQQNGGQTKGPLSDNPTDIQHHHCWLRGDSLALTNRHALAMSCRILDRRSLSLAFSLALTSIAQRTMPAAWLRSGSPLPPTMACCGLP